MSQAAAAFVTARCPRCEMRLPLTDFSPGASACRPCKVIYATARKAAIAEGTWRAQGYPRYTLATERPVARPVSPFLTPPPGADAALRNAILDYFRAYGFTRLRTTTESLIVELSKNKRVELAREGWIA